MLFFFPLLFVKFSYLAYFSVYVSIDFPHVLESSPSFFPFSPRKWVIANFKNLRKLTLTKFYASFLGRTKLEDIYLKRLYKLFLTSNIALFFFFYFTSYWTAYEE